MNQFKWKNKINTNILLYFELIQSLKSGKTSDPFFKNRKERKYY